MAEAPRDRILVLDYGSQYTQLIARRVREQRVYCEIHPLDPGPRGRARLRNPAGIVLSGRALERPRGGRAGPRSRGSSSSGLSPCSASATGCSSWCTAWAAVVEKADDREYGRALLKLERDDPLFGLPGGDAERRRCG